MDIGVTGDLHRAIIVSEHEGGVKIEKILTKSLAVLNKHEGPSPFVWKDTSIHPPLWDFQSLNRDQSSREHFTLDRVPFERQHAPCIARNALEIRV